MSWLLLIALAGCERDTGEAADEAACADSSQCEVGEGCVDGACVVAECFSSADCALGTICYEDIYTCVDGCEADIDCFAGQSCSEAGTCEEDPETCTSSVIDCGIGEACEQGSCEQPPEPFCMECDGTGICSGIGGSDDYACYTLPEFEVPRCGIPCLVDAECPQGFYCGTIGYEDGTTVTNCMGPCYLLD